MYRDSTFSYNARQWIDGNRSVAAVIVILMLLVGIVLSILGQHAYDGTESVALVVEQAEPDEPAAQEVAPASQTIIVHVVGAVVNPGVYTLEVGARVIDAVCAAAGFTENAAQESVNMAQGLSDGVQIRVPTFEDLEAEDSAAVYGVIGIEGAKASASQAGSLLVDINSADAALLETLPGIGPSTSAKIIAERQSNGPFRSLKDLARVSGIGEKKITALEGIAEAR